jgi:hypothetical protein
MEDLLYQPLQQRPRVRLGDGSEVPLEPRHVYMLKVDVEGFDITAMHGLRRLLMEDERPAAVTLEFFPDMAMKGGCDPAEFARFMYSREYAYEDMSSVEDMMEALRTMDATDVFEGWWRLRQH